MSRPFRIVAVALLLLVQALPALGESLVAYVPHITKGDAVWQDFLLVTNTGTTTQQFNLEFYDAGALLSIDPHQIAPGQEQLINLKQESPGASMASISYVSADLNFRQIFKNTASGLAEFALTNASDYQIAFKFSNALGANLLNWSGLALANVGDKDMLVGLAAIGHDGSLIGAAQLQLPRKSRVVGTHDVWFPNLSKNDIAQVIAVAAGLSKLAGIVISGTADSSRLLFTPAFPQPGFPFGHLTSGYTLTLASLLPQANTTYTTTGGCTLSYGRNATGQIDINLSRTDVNKLLLDLQMTLGSQELFFFAFTSFAAQLTWSSGGFLLPSDPTVPSEDLSTFPCNEYFVGKFKGSIPLHTDSTLDGPWYLVDYDGTPSETHALTFNLEFAGARHTVKLWLAQGRGILKLAYDGQEFTVTGKK